MPDEASAGTGEGIKRRLFDNQFAAKLRIELVVDHGEFAALITTLRDLKVAWRGRHLVEKDVVQELYYLAPLIWNVSRSFEEHDPAQAHQLSEMATEVDALVIEILHEPEYLDRARPNVHPWEDRTA